MERGARWSATGSRHSPAPRAAREGVGREAVMGEKGERPERVFPGRTDPWFIAAMVIVAGGLSAACIACFLSSSPALLWGWLALVPVPALVALAALPVRSNRLELYGDRLVVVYAGMRSEIPYAHVRGVRRTRTLWAGTGQLARPRLHRGALRRRRHRLGDRQRCPRGGAGAQVRPRAMLPFLREVPSGPPESRLHLQASF